MKRIGAIVCLSVLITLLSASICFGAGLELEDTYPKNNQTNTSIENLCVKLYFNSSVSDAATQKANADCFEIVDDKGKAIPIRVLARPEDKGLVLVLADNTKIRANEKISIKEDTKYTLRISGDFIDDKGVALGQDSTISFTTLNQSRSNSINMILMVVMFGAIFIFSSRSMKKQMAKQGVEKKEEKVNPYKEAKRTGKSVEEIVERTEKEKARKAARDARKRARGETVLPDEEDDYDYSDDNYYRVKRPRPISEAGSTYKTGRKAEAEKRAAEAAKKAKYAAQNKNKGKGKKKK